MQFISPSIKPYPSFHVQEDCEQLRKAMKGLGTDEAMLISILCRRSWQQRTEIERMYKQMFGKSLEKEVASETGGNFHKVLKRLLMTPVELAAYELHRAVEGAGTDEDALIEIICTETSEDLAEVKRAYKREYGKDLEDDVKGDTSGHFKRLLVSLLTCQRPVDGPADWAAAQADAKALFEAGEKRAGTDESRFNTILCSRSYSQLCAIFDVYSREYKTDIIDVIKSEFSGNISKALQTVVKVIRNRPAYFAERLNAAMKGAGTKDEMLIRIIVSRADYDLASIKAEYFNMYGKMLSMDVNAETSGDYKKALLAIIGDD